MSSPPPAPPMPQGMVMPEYQTPAGILYADPRRASTLWRWTAFLLAPLIWTIPAALLGAIVSVLTGIAFVPFGWFIAPFLTLLLLNLMARAIANGRRRNGKLILDYVDTAVRLNLPLPQFLRAAENSETGRIRKQLHVLRECIEAYGSVAMGLESVVDIPEEDARTIAAHESLGQLRVALARLKERQRQTHNDREERPDAGIYQFYPQFVVVVLVVFLVGFMIFVAPKFNEIFKDFRTTMPPVAKAVFGIGSYISQQPLLAIPLGLLSAAAIIIPGTVYMQRIMLPSWPEPRFATLWSWLKWRLPFFHGMERDAAMAAACDLWAEAVSAGVPLPTAVRRAAQLPMNNSFRRRIVDFGVRLERGAPAADAARAAGMPELLVGMLAPLSAGVGVSAGAMFGFLARYYRQKFSRAVVTLQAAAGPLTVLVMGSIVMTILVAIFSSLVVLQQSEMAEPWRWL